MYKPLKQSGPPTKLKGATGCFNEFSFYRCRKLLATKMMYKGKGRRKSGGIIKMPVLVST